MEGRQGQAAEGEGLSMGIQPHAASGKPEGISLTDSLRDYIHSTTLRSGFFVDGGYGRSLTACIWAVMEHQYLLRHWITGYYKRSLFLDCVKMYSQGTGTGRNRKFGRAFQYPSRLVWHLGRFIDGIRPRCLENRSFLWFPRTPWPQTSKNPSKVEI